MENKGEWYNPNDAPYEQQAKRKAYEREMKEFTNKLMLRINVMHGKFDEIRTAIMGLPGYQWPTAKQLLQDEIGSLGKEMNTLLGQIRQDRERQAQELEEEEELLDEEEEEL